MGKIITIKELPWVTSNVAPLTLWRVPGFSCRSSCGRWAGQDLVSALENLQGYSGRILSQRGESDGPGLSRTGRGRQELTWRAWRGPAGP